MTKIIDFIQACRSFCLSFFLRRIWLSALEGDDYGTPVIHFPNFSSLPERWRRSHMVNPYNPDELLRAMEMGLNDDNLKKYLIKKDTNK